MTPDNPKPILSTNFAARLLHGALALLMSCPFPLLVWEVLVRAGSSPPGKTSLENWFLGLAAAALAQELSHLVSGALAGFRFLWFAVVPLRPTCAPLLVPRVAFFGQCLMFPTDTRDLRRRYLLFFAGGPIFGFLLTALAVAGLYRALNPEPGANLSLFLERTAILGAALGLLRLIPSGEASNGFCLRTLLRGGQAADQLIATSTIAVLDMAGRRREDMDPGLLAALTLPTPSARWGMLGAHFAYFLALDAGRIEEARVHLAHWSTAVAGEPLQSAAELETAYFAARHDGDAPTARRHLESACGASAVPAVKVRSEAAVLLAEGRVREARQILSRATRLLPWREHGRDVTSRVVLESLRALGQEAAWTPVPTGIDGYLDEICIHLIGLPDGKRTEIREELRPHLISLVDAYEELGHASEEAVTLALRRFGAPATLAREIAKAQPPTGFRHALGCAVCWFGGAAALFGWMVALFDLPPGPFPLSVTLFLGTAFFVLPAVAGWKTGAAVQERAGMITFYALAILAFTGIVLGPLLINANEPLGLSVFLLSLIAAVWMPVGCLAAALSGERLQRLRRQRQEAMKLAWR